MKYIVKSHPGNKSGSLPGHHDIHAEGTDDSIITVWGSKELADAIAFQLPVLMPLLGVKPA